MSMNTPNLINELGGVEHRAGAGYGAGVGPEDIAVANMYNRRQQPMFFFFDQMRIQRAVESLRGELKKGHLNPNLLKEYDVKLLGEWSQDGLLCALTGEQAAERSRIRVKEYLLTVAAHRACDANDPTLLRVEAERRIHQLELDSRSTRGSPALFVKLVMDALTSTEVKQTLIAGLGAETAKRKSVIPWRS